MTEREPIWMPVTTWRKSSYSDGSVNSDCVEVALGVDALVRDSKNTTGPVLRFRIEAWRGFITRRGGRRVF